MVIATKDWMENVEDTKPLLDSNSLIMATPGQVNSNDNSVRNDWKQQVQSTITPSNNRNSFSSECARAVLICHPNSHPFQTRTLLLEPNQEVKVGRSIARSKVSENNAIFDCRVLSRNHAVLWYSDGKFYVKDTRSSNGTFINERRIAQSEPEELNFGDIVKFGVDVVENSRKEVHGSIISCVKLYLPDGREYISNNSNRFIPGEGTISLDELHRLHHYMQEAVQREKVLEVKLHDIQKIIEVTRRNTSTCWQAMIDEDSLLNRIDILENKLQFFQKNASEDSLRDEILKLQEDKSLYQNSAKEALRKVYQERMDAMQKLSTIERALCSSEDECSLLRDQLLRSQQNLQEVNCRLTRFEAECKEHRDIAEKAQTQVQNKDSESQQLNAQIKEKEKECEKYKNQVSALLIEKSFIQKKLEGNEKSGNESDEEDTISKVSNVSRKGTVLKWLENSDLKNKEESAEIIKAICNDTDDNGDDNFDIDIDLTLAYNKLMDVEKKLSQLEENLTKEGINTSDGNCTSSPSVNNGNTNIENQPDYQEALKSNTASLIEIYNEMFHNFLYLKTAKETLDNRGNINEIKAKLSRTQEELHNLQIELETRPTYNQFQEKISANELLQNDIDTLNLKQIDMQEQINKLESEKVLLESLRNSNTEMKNTNNDCLQKDIDCKEESMNLSITPEEKSHDSVDIDTVQSDLDILSNPTIQHEEELVIFKEKYETITNENLKLRNMIAHLEIKQQDVKKEVAAKYIIISTVFIAFISYFFVMYL